MTNRASWALRVFNLAWQKEINYKADFWVNFIIRTMVSLAIPYFTWTAIFEIRGVSEMNGMNLPDLIVYYALANGCFNLTQGHGHHAMANNEIYSGGLSKYLLYPVPFQGYALANYLGLVSAYFVQFAIVLLSVGIFGTRFHGLDFPVVASLSMGLLHVLAATFVHFFLLFALECVSYWAERVWSLMVMMRFISSILGGRLLPLTMLPIWAQSTVQWTPFPYLTSAPVKAFMGELTWAQTFEHLLILIFWCFIFWVIGQLIFRRGLKTYTGVGI